MGVYLVKRLLLIIPTLLGIILINFVIVQFAPGGPVEQIIAQTTFGQSSTTTGISGGSDAGPAGNVDTGDSSASYGLPPEIIEELERQFGFDKPAHERFLTMVSNYVVLDFGNSFFQDRPVIELIIERMPVSISLGLWSLLMIYGISIPLGIAKAVRNGSPFDIWTSSLIFIGYAIPGFIFAVLLIVLFAGGNYLDLFPLRGLTSDNWVDLSWGDRILDYLWHLCLPIMALTIGGFATLTMLTKNSFLEEISKQFVLTARAKGLTEQRVLYGHVFRNAMLIVIAGFPAAFIGILFTGSLLIEVIFSLDGMGLLSYEAVIKRDYPILFGTLFCFTLIGLVMHLIGDLVYVLVDPRIDFETRE
ncbi:MAG TPA: microcin C ABC transporter permease YejB [Arenicellales bacterium]|jgi:microcin C transport system permease protein|nr:microcin ABC transporter permease [Gammaproteobacteria bacterium]MDP6026202.1 microcin C ABC transporter permease YejB [Pseudomonadales bacterium]HJL52271.1 microcin C ABC transporter permease YejB [Arenicellales bacterium]MDP6314933.1 microcin C ABC transporter permease YejB [Pseudomonadales bacterium]MDP7314811.1 microcin C ABC transporter permease YejB [Pseudomonadales bacterium]|tara:strand:- start:3272 stop:4354 length:1083 start_codon:yes stop_codon:yes gene_type:complete